MIQIAAAQSPEFFCPVEAAVLTAPALVAAVVAAELSASEHWIENLSGSGATGFGVDKPRCSEGCALAPSPPASQPAQTAVRPD